MKIRPVLAESLRRGRAPLCAVAVLALAACASPPMETPATAQPMAATTAAPAPAVAPAPATPANPGAVAADGASRVASLTAPTVAPAPTEASVFFAFDDYTISSEYMPAIEGLGRYFGSAPGAALRVEGHADERGSHEYNLALGQKRAEAVVRALRTYGVRDDQVEAVSFGEERPRAAGHDEASWSQNRRADMRPRTQP